jgi:diguanylate cyclase (GGDEF)-like protein
MKTQPASASHSHPTAERLAALHRASQDLIIAETDMERIYSAIHKAVQSVMPCEAFAIALYDEAAHQIEGVYLIDRGGRAPYKRIAETQGLSGEVIRTGKSLYIPDFDDSTSDIQAVHYGSAESIRSVIAAPMRLGGNIIGILTTQSYKPLDFCEEDTVILEMLAAYAAIAVQNARLLAELQALATHDPLTGLPNRRVFDLTLHNEILRANRYGNQFALLFIDIDDFKKHNDTFGHLSGDERLKELTKILLSQVRAPDLVARYGGEEFVIILPHATAEGGYKVALRICEFSAEISPSLPLPPGYTVSIGVAIYPHHGDSAQSLTHAADRAMLQAKQAGKNRAVLAQ